MKRFEFLGERGQGLAEYALLITAVALTAVGIMSLLGVQIGDVVCTAVAGFGDDGLCDSTLFADDFGGTLSQWRSFYNRPQNWEISDDDNPKLCHVGSGGDFLLAENSSGNDYQISTNANITTGNGYGILFRPAKMKTAVSKATPCNTILVTGAASSFCANG